MRNKQQLFILAGYPQFMIQSCSFGLIVINGKSYGDIKLIGNKTIQWHHVEHHAVTEQDMFEIFDSKPDVVVIGTGFSGLVEVKDEVVNLAKDKNIELVILQTKQACEAYNNLLKGKKKVAMILHSTC